MKFLTEHGYVISSLELVSNSGLAFSYSAVRLNFRTLVSLASQLPPEAVEEATDDTIAPLLVAAWEIVEYADAIRQFLNLRFPGFLQKGDLQELLDTCNSLRNSKVHIAQKARNLSRTGGLLPLHGILKWTHDDPVASEGRYYDIPLVSVEPMPYVDKPDTGKKTAGGLSFDASDGIRVVLAGASNFSLLAFSERLDITYLMELLDVLSDELMQSWKQAIQEAHEVAAEQGEELLKTEYWLEVASKPVRWVVRASSSSS